MAAVGNDEATIFRIYELISFVFLKLLNGYATGARPKIVTTTTDKKSMTKVSFFVVSSILNLLIE